MSNEPIEHAHPAREEMKKQGDALAQALEPSRPPESSTDESSNAPELEVEEPMDVTPKAERKP